MKYKRTDWRVSHPNGRGIVGPQGFGSTTSSGLNWLGMGGPGDPPLTPPGHSLPNLPPQNQPFPTPPANPLQGISDAIKAITGDFLSAGEIMIGVALIVVGLLLATGLLERGARTAIRAAPVGRITRAIRR